MANPNFSVPVRNTPKKSTPKQHYSKSNNPSRRQIISYVIFAVVILLVSFLALILRNRSLEERSNASYNFAVSCSTLCNNGASFSDACPGAPKSSSGCYIGSGTFGSCGDWATQACASRGGVNGYGGTTSSTCPNSCSGNTGGTTGGTTTPACKDGALKCSGSKGLKCRQGTWVTVQNCGQYASCAISNGIFVCKPY
ncbi:MAG TPA: hypothetical protein VLH19_03345 [Patescibacteria group bacterium]|nr:hypothetical protein [Patescibacteria group bacterium]